jgi:hypothetical protein
VSEQRQYKPGDVVSGHILSAEGQWFPIQAPPTAPPQEFVQSIRPGMSPCRGCGNVIAQGARQCPACGKNTRRGEFTNFILGIGVAVLIMIALGIIFGSH